MAQQQSTATLPAAQPFRRSLSDRPVYVRWAFSTLRFIKTKPLGAFGLLIILIIGFMAVFADYVDRYGPRDVIRVPPTVCKPEQIEDKTVECFSPELLEKAKSDITVRLQYPASRFQQGTGGGNVLSLAPASSDHWLGTDKGGRDLYSRIVHGSRLALLYGLGAAAIAVVGGTVLGMISAYFGGIVDMVFQRITDAFFAFPNLILLLIFSQVVPDPNIYFTMFALGLIGVASVTRIARATVLTTREEVYVMAARTVGASDPRIMLRHILPNIVAPLIVIFTISIGAYILAEAGLAFIGLSDPTAISWGVMVNDGRLLGAAKPQMALYVGGALTLTVLGFNLFGDAIRDVLDPRLRGRGGRAGF